MPDPVFRLRVPLASEYRGLATDVVVRYFELIGGRDTDGQALGAAFGQAVDALVEQEGAEAATAELDVSCTRGPEGGAFEIRCGSRSAVVAYPGPGRP